MWLKLDKSDDNYINVNKEIAYAYLTLRSYIDDRREKWLNFPAKLKNNYLKRLYKSMKNESLDKVRVN